MKTRKKNHEMGIVAEAETYCDRCMFTKPCCKYDGDGYNCWLCYDCAVSIGNHEICNRAGHLFAETHRGPCPSEWPVDPGILISYRCKRCDKCKVELSAIYD